MSTSPEAITSLAQQWLELDQDPATRTEIQDLLRQNDHAALSSQLQPYITFGTAGLRARMEAGFARLNALTIVQATQGLAEYVLRNGGPAKSVVIGRDARHNSEKFAKLTAAVFSDKGFIVHYYPVTVHTPLVPFGVNYLGAAVGVMITASHNPAQDNGYKVYWGNGCQIIPPHDKGIAESIAQNLRPMRDYVAFADSITSLSDGAVPWNTQSLKSVQNGYFQSLSSIVKLSPPTRPFVYTPMHGVGLPYMQKAVGDSKHMVVVKEQAEPDPEFPTVKFPNPEEKGALDLAMEAAERNNATIIVATDPDADRLAVAEKVEGVWHQFTGNQLGILLASYIFSVYCKEHSNDVSKLSMLATTVSSQMLSHMAAVEGFHFDETLTGFKWLGNRAIDLERTGYDVQFGFEQAIGYMLPKIAHDKDGISAATLFLAACAAWDSSEKGSLTPWGQLQTLYKKYGYFADIDAYVRSPSPADTTAAFARIRAFGQPFPAEFAPGQKILSWRDLTIGYDSREPDNKPRLPVDSATEMITVEVEGGVRFTVRGSGTEPKIKLYVEGKGANFEEARAKADAVVNILLEVWLPGFPRG